MTEAADLIWMEHALHLAKQATESNEVPVGAVLVLENNIIGEGSNRPIGDCDPSAHAEIVALRAGAKAIGNYRILQSTLYVTLEPCVMCLGAIVQARVKRVVFGAFDPKAGAVCSVFTLGLEKFNHQIEYQGGVLAEQCGELLSAFFKERRQKIIPVSS